MPIYEYRCDDCEVSFETFLRPGDDEDAECPTCHGGRLSREMSVFAQARSGRAEGASAAGFGGPSAGGCCGGSCGCRH